MKETLGLVSREGEHGGIVTQAAFKCRLPEPSPTVKLSAIINLTDPSSRHKRLHEIPHFTTSIFILQITVI